MKNYVKNKQFKNLKTKINLIQLSCESCPVVWVQGVLEAIGPLDKFNNVENPEMLLSFCLLLSKKPRLELVWGPGDPMEAGEDAEPGSSTGIGVTCL